MKDNDERTRAMIIPRRVAIGGALAIMASVVTFPAGYIKYNGIIKKSSTPTGTEMKFNRSNAIATLKGLYTDNQHTALVARLGVDSESSAQLPSRGTDYKVFISSPAIPKGIQEIDILFGRLGTDGDMFLVLPKPTMDVYTIIIMNTKYLASARDILNRSQASTEQQDAVNLESTEESITKALSNYTYNPSDSNDKGVLDIQTNQNDLISFRMTLDPAYDKPEFKPMVLDTVLLDNNNQFQFENMFNKLFKEAAYGDLQKQHDRILTLESQLNDSIKEYSDRLAVNPSDVDTSKALSETRDALNQLETQKTDIASQMNIYENLKYDDATFANIQTKAKVVSGDVTK